MKKLFLAMAAVAALFASCSKDDTLTGVSKSKVSFTVSAPELATRAGDYGNGQQATTLYYAVYDAVEGTSYVGGLSNVSGEDFAGGKKEITLALVEGRTYDIIFYAQNAAESPYYVNWDAKTLNINGEYLDSDKQNKVLTANKEAYDAFYAHVDQLKVGNQAINKTVDLKRPFAQLNILTNDTDLAAKAGIDIDQSEVTVKNIYTSMNLFTDKVVPESETAVTYAMAAIPGDEVTVNSVKYNWLSMNYLLVNEKKMVDVEFKMHDESVATGQEADAILSRTYTPVAVERNHRTNIYGSIITNPAKFNVEIKAGFLESDYNYPVADVWDGVSANNLAPVTDENGDPVKVNDQGIVDPNGGYTLYEIESAADAAGFRNMVMGIANGTPSAANGNVALDTRSGEAEANNFAKAYIKLMTDVDLNWEEWEPIGSKDKPFNGIFDGNGKVIRNLSINTPAVSYVGLFGWTNSGEIKNLIVENAKVAGYLGVGVVAGCPYTTKYTNITVRGHVEVNGMSYVGGVGGKNAYANWTDITVDVDGTSYVKANSIENGTAYRTYVGGVVGFNGEGGHTFKNIKSNINVSGSTCDVGGLFGIAHYGNKFENCSSSGTVEIFAAAEAAEAEEIGGIAGVWHNGGADVVMNGCSFTGTLKANNNYVINTQRFGNLVCASYAKTGNGKLIIDGVAYQSAEYGVIVDGVYNVDNANSLTEAIEGGHDVKMIKDIKIDPANMSNAYGTTGLNVKNGQTIDGGGYTLDIKGAGGTWDSGINTTGGTIKNITVTGSFRGIFINHNSTHSEKVILENVTTTGTTYTISCDQGTNQGLEAKNSAFYGWTSYAATIGDVKFTNCTFGEGNGYAYCRPYAPTEFVGCEFEAGFEMDTRATVTFENCTLDGEPLTAENLATLVTSNIANASVK